MLAVAVQPDHHERTVGQFLPEMLLDLGGVGHCLSPLYGKENAAAR
jgi:hypothetical protein